jgi:hypothetical protein
MGQLATQATGPRVSVLVGGRLIFPSNERIGPGPFPLSKTSRSV